MAVGALASCSRDSGATPDPTPSVSVTPTESPILSETQAPATDPADTEIVADQFSQVIDGVLYQGTEKAPVRIGTDTPGQPPAAEATTPEFDRSTLDTTPLTNAAIAADKYLIFVMDNYTDGVGGTAGGTLRGYGWVVYQTNAYGNFKGLSQQGFTSGEPFPTIEAAVAGPFTVDGRVLDRAEYVVRYVSLS